MTWGWGRPPRRDSSSAGLRSATRLDASWSSPALRLIVSMTLAAGQSLLDELRQCPAQFDVIVVDEAHHLAERGSRTKRLTLLGRQLSRACKDGTLMLLTATPHD